MGEANRLLVIGALGQIGSELTVELRQVFCRSTKPTPPGGGTTDYAAEIYYAAVKHRRYTCFVSEETVLPMMYIPDCIRATIELMKAPFDQLRHRGGYNVAAMSFSAGELAAEIRRHLADFECVYEPDERQEFAVSWPQSIDDSAAREDWGWRPEFDLASMTRDMLETLQQRQSVDIL